MFGKKKKKEQLNGLPPEVEAVLKLGDEAINDFKNEVFDLAIKFTPEMLLGLSVVLSDLSESIEQVQQTLTKTCHFIEDEFGVEAPDKALYDIQDIVVKMRLVSWVDFLKSNPEKLDQIKEVGSSLGFDHD